MLLALIAPIDLVIKQIVKLNGDRIPAIAGALCSVLIRGIPHHSCAGKMGAIGTVSPYLGRAHKGFDSQISNSHSSYLRINAFHNIAWLTVQVLT